MHLRAARLVRPCPRDFIVFDAGAVTDATRLFARAWMRLREGTVQPHSWYVVAGVYGGGGAYENGQETRLGTSAGMIDLNWMPVGAGEITRFSNGVNNDQGPPETFGPGIVWGPDEWHCVEVMFDSMEDTFQLWIDDDPVPEMTVEQWDIRNAPDEPIVEWTESLDYIKFGAQGASTNADFDDIAVGTERIFCNQR